MTLHEVLDWPFTDTQQTQFRGRAYGHSTADLAIDFHQAARPVIISSILGECVARADGAAFSSGEIWAWTASRRLQALLTVVIRSQGPALDVGTTCPEPNCGELLELPVRLPDFEHVGEHEPIRCSPAGGTDLSLRLPTGSDQRYWLENGLTDAAALASRLVVGVDGVAPNSTWQVDSAWLDVIEATLSAADPLNDITIDSCCPHCGLRFNLELDLELELLTQLEHRQQALFDDVHRIASAYHWTEEQILRLSRERRRAYLARIDEALH